MKYYNFDLELTGYDIQTSQFRVRVIESSDLIDGQHPSDATTVSLPAQIDEYKNELAFRTLNLEGLITLGEILASAMFPSSVHDLYKLMRAKLKANEGIRIRLRIDRNSLTLANTPWEYVHLTKPDSTRDVTGFLALDPQISLVRRESMTGENIPSLDPVTNGMRLVALLANVPNSPVYANLELAKEQEIIQESLKDLLSRGAVRPEYYPDMAQGITQVTRDVLHKKVIKGIHVLHFAGHGTFVTKMGESLGSLVGAGSLVLCNEQGEADLVQANDLELVLKGRQLRLVVLSACEGATRDNSQAWTGVVPALTRAGIPAVVGMQYKIKDSNAIAFSSAFYTALAEGFSVDEAVREGRLAIRFRSTDEMERDWGIPALYLRVQDEQKQVVLFPKADQEDNPRTSGTHIQVNPQQQPSDHSTPLKTPISIPDKVTLRTFIATNFNLRQGEFDLLCENLTTNYAAKKVKVSMDDIGGNTAQIAALNLISYMDRRGWLPYLVEQLRVERPDMPL